MTFAVPRRRGGSWDLVIYRRLPDGTPRIWQSVTVNGEDFAEAFAFYRWIVAIFFGEASR